jgi:hypothetical protein
MTKKALVYTVPRLRHISVAEDRALLCSTGTNATSPTLNCGAGPQNTVATQCNIGSAAGDNSGGGACTSGLEAYAGAGLNAACQTGYSAEAGSCGGGLSVGGGPGMCSAHGQVAGTCYNNGLTADCGFGNAN